jgi:hypothetical protein
MRVDALGDARPVAVRLHDLLHAARCEGRAALRFEQVPVPGVGLQVATQDEAEAFGKGLSQAQLPSGLLTNMERVGVVWLFPVSEANDLGNNM